MKSAGKARSNGLYRHIRTSKEIIRNLLNYSFKNTNRDFYRDYKYICKDVDKEISCELELIRRADVFLDHIS